MKQSNLSIALESSQLFSDLKALLFNGNYHHGIRIPTEKVRHWISDLIDLMEIITSNDELFIDASTLASVGRDVLNEEWCSSNQVMRLSRNYLSVVDSLHELDRFTIEQYVILKKFADAFQ